jgi:hypothetical protein
MGTLTEEAEGNETAETLTRRASGAVGLAVRAAYRGQKDELKRYAGDAVSVVRQLIDYWAPKR